MSSGLSQYLSLHGSQHSISDRSIAYLVRMMTRNGINDGQRSIRSSFIKTNTQTIVPLSSGGCGLMGSAGGVCTSDLHQALTRAHLATMAFPLALIQRCLVLGDFLYPTMRLPNRGEIFDGKYAILFISPPPSLRSRTWKIPISLLLLLWIYR